MEDINLHLRRFHAYQLQNLLAAIDNHIQQRNSLNIDLEESVGKEIDINDRPVKKYYRGLGTRSDDTKKMVLILRYQVVWQFYV